ncbi:hypothetical protein [Hungatella hathewayi]|nr:hypothetical protein [Hungatella hathewayi]
MNDEDYRELIIELVKNIGDSQMLKALFRSVYKELHADHETGAADNK